jgi:uncharacterized protein YukJ
MAIQRYSLLKGRVIDRRNGSGRNPHYQMLVADEADHYRVAVNVRSHDDSEVLYLVRTRFEHPITDDLAELAPGLHAVESRPGGLALDYIRANLMQPDELVPLPVSAPGPDNDLNDKIGHYVERALADADARIYAFGQAWGPERKRDEYFGFRPSRGVHDIHMNQGNPAPPAGRRSFYRDNGIWRDGGLIFQFPAQAQWVAVFLKFQGQHWHTHDRTGRPLALAGRAAPDRRQHPGRVPRHHRPTRDVPDGLVRIVAALVHDVRAPERETVTLLNPSGRAIDLSGWHLADRNKNKTALSGRIGAGATLKVAVVAPMQLSNQGGIITLLDDRGVKVHGVSYGRAAASHPGQTIVFQ